MKKVILCLSAIFLLFTLLLPSSPAYAENLDQQLEDVKMEREETGRQIEQAEKEERAYESQIEHVEEQMITVLGELDGLRQELEDIKLEIFKTNLMLELKGKELEETEKELQHKIDLLNWRVSEIYKNRDSHYIQVVLIAEDFMDFMSKIKIMAMIAEQDANMITEVKARREAVASIRQNIHILNELQNEQKDEVERLVAEQEIKKQELEAIHEQKKGLLLATIANRNELIEMEKQLAAKEAQIKKKLESLRHGNTPGGKMAWPTNGILISGFGYRQSPIFGDSRFHSGIDIACDTGTPVIAAETGQVLDTSYMGGYGNSIIIYHGGGIATLYAHLSAFGVSPGQQVQKGQIIGYVGTTGWTTGPHLHFEVRMNGVPQNPLNYL